MILVKLVVKIFYLNVRTLIENRIELNAQTTWNRQFKLAAR